MSKSHPLRTVLTFLAPALCLVIATLWLRSYLPETVLWESDRGRVLLIGTSQVRADAREFRDRRTMDKYLRDLMNPQFSPNAPPREHRLLGFYYAHGDDEGAAFAKHLRIVGVPYWFLFTVVAAPTVLLLRRHRLARRRRAASLCPMCGYDCRATPGRCPECGIAPAS